MLPKIRYRLVYNYAGRLNRDGRAPVAVEARQGTRKRYFSTQVLVTPEQWLQGKVVNHSNAPKLNVYIYHRMQEVEEIELDALLGGRSLTLFQLKTAVRSGVRASAEVGEFIEAVIGTSSRSLSTKRAYRYLANDISRTFGRVTISDITFDFIERYRNAMRQQGLSENTVKGRLKQLHCLVSEALKRNLISEDPFRFVTIGNMSARVGYLEAREVRRLERLEVTGKEEKVRDLFLLACYTGLRWSDLSTLEEADISGGMLHKRMKKTSYDVHIPIDKLFWGKGRVILEKYPDIRRLSHACSNTQANRILKDLAVRAGIRKRVYIHLGRKTCSNMLNAMGMSLQDISSVLGHCKIDVTAKHYVFNSAEHVRSSAGHIFKKMSETPEKTPPKTGSE